MLHLKKGFRSTVGLKYLMSLSGIILAAFVIFHLIANLYLLLPNSASYNLLSNSLTALGRWLVLAEIFLLICLFIHIVVAVRLKIISLRARPVSYVQIKTKGGPSKEGFASTRLFLTGLVILIFIVVHVIQFKFGPGISEGYSSFADGKTVRDLRRLVDETFFKSYWAGFYVVSMIFLGFHLRHGFWSLFQSLGATNRRTTLPLYHVGTWLAVIIALGFGLIPIFIFVRGVSQ
jgi:succinate dehydrogenase / fumarate reductase cytochrome b subunit